MKQPKQLTKQPKQPTKQQHPIKKQNNNPNTSITTYTTAHTPATPQLPQIETLASQARLVTPRVILDKAISNAELALTRIHGIASDLTVSTPIGYQRADHILTQIRTARDEVRTLIHTHIITPIRTGLDAWYEIYNRLDKPLAEYQNTVTALMRSYKLAEMARIEAETALQAAEVARRQVEADLARERALNAATAKEREEAERKADYLDSAAKVVALTPATAPVRVEGTSSRKVRKFEVEDVLELITGVGDGSVPFDVFEVSKGRLRQYWNENPERVASWPGIRTWDDVELARKG